MNYQVLLISIFFSSFTFAKESIQYLHQQGDYFTIEEIYKKRKTYTLDEAKLVIDALLKLNNHQSVVKMGRSIYRRAPETCYILGQSLFALKKFKESYSFFKRCVSLDFKRDISLFYLGSIAQEVGRDKLAEKYFHQIFENQSYDTSLRQTAQFQRSKIFYNKYSSRGITTPRLFQNVILPQLEKALHVNPEGDQAEVIQQKITELKRKYRLGWLESTINFSQTIGTNSNVIYQSISPLQNRTTDSPYSSSFLNYSKGIGIPLHIPIEMSVRGHINNDHYFNDDQLIKRFNKVSGGLGVSGKLTPNLNKSERYWQTNIDYSYSLMDNQLNNQYVFDHHHLSLSLMKNINRTTLQASASVFQSFDAANDFYNLITSIGFFKKTSRKSNYYLSFDASGSFYPNSNPLNTIEAGINVQFNYLLFSNQYFVSGLSYRGILPYKNKDQRGLEQLMSLNLGWQYYLGQNHSIGTSLNYQKKSSKDESTFSFNQTTANVNYIYNFKGF